MKVRIVGKKLGTFPNDRGVDIPFGKIYCLCEPPEDDGSVYEGLVPDTFGINAAKIEDIPVNCDAEIGVNSSGKVVSIKLL